MAFSIFIPKETAPGEARVAATPDTVKKLISLGATLQVESGAGASASVPDEAYQAAGAVITDRSAIGSADLVLVVNAAPLDFNALKRGAGVAGLVDPYQNADLLARAARAGVNLLAMDLVPRITRAQAMDVLSSQANLAGYRAVIDAAAHYGRAFPMMMTAAGTVAAAKVFVMGAGVAGLQAIATARRLGAVVSATDVRLAAKEQVQSLGASFVMVEDDETKAAETSGGYAREMSDAYKVKQAALIAATIAKQDIVITTALIPGRKAPVLVTSAMVESMKAGSVIIDLAAANGGNCEATHVDEITRTKNGVCVIGYRNMPARLAADASALYAKNILNLMGLLVKDGALSLESDDEIITAMRLTAGGAIVHPNFLAAQAA